MKLSTFLLFVSIFNVLGSKTYSQNARLNLDMKDVPIRTVLNAIEGQSEFFFLYSSKMIDINQMVNINVADKKITEVLDELLANTEIKYAVRDRQILLVNKETDFAAIMQQNKITGTVTDETGSPLQGVTIQVKGTATGVFTDAEGKYSLNNIPENATLVFSFIGMTTQEIPLNGRTQIDVVLVKKTVGLEEVVVIGYGTQKKSSVTAAVSTIDIGEALKTKYSDATQALQGRVAGLSVTIGTEPGGSPKVQVRGTGSLTNLVPLYVIDGAFATSMESLSANDIESIQVLKDASAAAIYGSRAANGVIIITTKNGKKDKLSVDFESSMGLQTVARKLDLMNAGEWAKMSNDYADVAGLPRAPKNDNNFDPAKSYDYQDYWMKKAPIYSSDLSLSGGNESAQYRASLGYLGQDGIVLGTGFKRYNSRINTKFTKGKYEISQTLSYTRREQEVALKGREFYEQPTISPYADTPSGYGVVLSDYNVGGGISPNSLVSYDLTDNWINSDILIGSINNSYEFVKGLKYHLNGSLNLLNSHNYTYQPTWVTLVDENGKAVQNEIFNPTISSLNEAWGQNLQYTIDNMLTYEGTFSNHNFDIMIGTSWMNESFREISIKKVGGFIDNSITVPKGDGTLNGSEYKTYLLSYFTRLNYDYANRYLMSFAIRRDESSLFNKNNRVGWFPSLSLGWNVHNEPFFNVSSIDKLKIRASYGQIGANFLKPYSYQTRIATNVPAIFGNDYRELGSIEILANSALQWETSTTLDLGFETELFKNKIYAEFDYYIKVNSDLLARLEAAPSSGQGVYYGQDQGAYYNTAKITNRGIDLLIGARPKIKELNLDISLVLSHIDNKVNELGENVQPISGGTISGEFDDRGTITMRGHKVSSYWGYITDGIYKDNPLPQDVEPNKKAGDFIFRDISGPDGVPDGKITEDDKTVIGSPWPDFEYGLNLSATYKNFDLTMFLQGSYGNDIFYFVKRYSYFNYGDNLVKDAGNYWSPTNTEGDVPRLMVGQMSSMNARPNSWYIEDGSYLRCKTLQIGYSFDNNLLNKLKINNLRVYFNIKNPFTITNFSGIDPEVTSVMGSGGVIDTMQDSNENFLFNRGMVLNEYPRDRTFMFGFRIGF